MRTHRNSNTENQEEKTQRVKSRKARTKTIRNGCQSPTFCVTLKLQNGTVMQSKARKKHVNSPKTVPRRFFCCGSLVLHVYVVMSCVYGIQLYEHLSNYRSLWVLFGFVLLFKIQIR